MIESSVLAAFDVADLEGLDWTHQISAGATGARGAHRAEAVRAVSPGSDAGHSRGGAIMNEAYERTLPPAQRGNIVFLNGTSSAGKSSIAQALQEVMEAPYLHTGIDHFLERFPVRFHVKSDGADPATATGFLWVCPDGQTL